MSAVQFYREENFKVVDADGFKFEVPEDWEVVRLVDVVEIYDSKRIPLSEQERSTIKGPYPYCGATGIIDYIDDYIFEGEYVLLAEDGGYFGPFEQSAYIMNGKFWVNNHAHVLKAKNGISDNWYLMYFLNYIDLRHYIVGSTRTKLNQADMRRIKISLPPLPEQQKIAHVLMSIDKAIEVVDEAIKQAECIKKGLMQELLTKGIGHTEFKDTEIGRIPEDWEVVRLGGVAEINKESINPPKEAPNKEFYYIEIDSIQDGIIKSVKKIIGKDAPSRARRLVRENDVIMSTVRPYLKAFALVPEKYDGQICSTGFAVLRCKKNLIIPNYLLYNLFMDRTIEQCNRLMVGGQYPALNQSHVEQLKIPLPPLEEQQKIAEILSKWDEVIEIKKAKKERLERMKKKVMDLLLTGKVRIK